MIEFECSCAMGKHRAPLEGYEISSGALNKIPEILKDYNKIYVVADENTYRAAGKQVEEILKACGKHHRTLVLDGEVVLPNVETLGKIVLFANDPGAKPNFFAYSDLPDFILAVGSGTVNDSCRLASYRLLIVQHCFPGGPIPLFRQLTLQHGEHGIAATKGNSSYLEEDEK